jgi:hypothetical protein
LGVGDLIPRGSRLADIGSDHAYLPVALMLENKLSFAVAGDSFIFLIPPLLIIPLSIEDENLHIRAIYCFLSLIIYKKEPPSKSIS